MLNNYKSRWFILGGALLSFLLFVEGGRVSAVGDSPAKPRRLKILVLDVHLERDTQAQLFFLPKLKAIFPADYTTVFWKEYSAERAEKLAPDLIILSPQNTPWPQYPPEEFGRLLAEVKQTSRPMLGICGGHQLLALAFGGKVGPLSPPAEGCEYPKSYRACTREKGFLPIEFKEKEPLFEGLNGQAVVWLNHSEEVSELPPNFFSVAGSAMTAVQVMRSTSHRVYGFQFHPEDSDRQHPEGVLIFKNAVRLLLNPPPG